MSYHYNKKSKSNKFIIPDSFLQTNYQYIVSDSFRFDDKADQNVLWNFIILVLFSPNEEYYCPICFEEPKSPRITPCGHIYCNPCLIHLFKGYNILSNSKIECSSKNEKCPICNTLFHINQVLPVKISSIIEKNINDNCNFTLLRRKRYSTISLLANELIENNNITIPYYKENNSKFCRFNIANPPNPRKGYFGIEAEILQEEKLDILKSLSHINNSEKLYYELALEHVLCRHSNILSTMEDCSWELEVPHFSVPRHYYDDDNEDDNNSNEDNEDNNNDFNIESWEDLDDINDIIDNNNDSTDIISYNSISNHNDNNKDKPIFNSKYIYYYQESSGKHIYIHPDNMKQLKKKYGCIENLPMNINLKIISKEEITINYSNRKQYNILSHLPITSICYLCKIEI